MSQLNALHECIMKFYHIVDRHADIKWHLEGPITISNLILIYEGQAYMESDGQGYTVKAGDLIHFRPGVYRRGHTFAKNPMKCLSISYDLFYYDHEKKLLVENKLPLEFVQTINSRLIFSRLKQFFSAMVDIWQSQDHYKSYELNSRFNIIIKELLKWSEVPKFNYMASQKVQSVIEYLNCHVTSHVRVDDISKLLGVSNSYISRIFKEYNGTTIINYFNRIKIVKSKDYLATGYSVSKCSELLGFNDLYYFSKVFRHYEGISPSEYAKRFI